MRSIVEVGSSRIKAPTRPTLLIASTANILLPFLPALDMPALEYVGTDRRHDLQQIAMCPTALPYKAGSESGMR